MRPDSFCKSLDTSPCLIKESRSLGSKRPPKGASQQICKTMFKIVTHIEVLFLHCVLRQCVFLGKRHGNSPHFYNWEKKKKNYSCAVMELSDNFSVHTVWQMPSDKVLIRKQQEVHSLSIWIRLQCQPLLPLKYSHD